MKCNVTRQTATWLQQADLRPIICRSYFGLQQADLISALGETRAWLQATPPWLQAK